MPGKRPESVLVVVHAASGEVLLLRRAEREPPFWQSVTGSLEWGETRWEAARREVVEETGIAPEGLIDCGCRRRFFIPPSWRERFAPGVTHNLEHEFRLELPAPREIRLAPGEHDAYRWLPRAEAIAQASSWTNRAAIRALPVAPERATVVLVHGLWLNRHVMRPLARQLRAAGFRTVLFGYPTTRMTPARAGARLADLIAGLDADTVHVVAHSLGGIVTSHMLYQGPPHRLGRVVLLGSPLRGASAAASMRTRGLDRLLGAARTKGLLGGAPPWPREIPTLAIAGVLACGPGRLFGRLPGPHDGTVTLRETAAPGAARRTLRVTHFGMLISGRVARAVVGFLAPR
jgi:dATP pyrophosphohydrolase